MSDSNTNPYHSPPLPQAREQATSRWPNWLFGISCAYYILSAATLPFANTAWIGELPIFAILQISKAFIKSLVQDTLLHAVNQFGWSAGLASPDYGITHPWAMIFMTVIPALILILVILRFGAKPTRNVFLFALVTCATIDAVATLWFDAASSLKLY